MDKNRIEFLCKLFNINKTIRRDGVDCKLEDIVTNNGKVTLIYHAPGVLRSVNIKGRFTTNE